MKSLRYRNVNLGIASRSGLRLGRTVFLAAGLFVTMSGLPVHAQQHAHLYAGALGTNRNDQLYFSNGALFAASSGYVQPLNFAGSGPYSGYFQGTLTFSALAATVNNSGPAFGHAALGAHLELQVVTVAGPDGGSFGFWEGNGEDNGEQLTFSVPVGTTNGTATFPLSENDGAPGTDPYGHIHGRIYTVTRTGLYTLGLRIIDTSTNGPGGGPVHTASDLFSMYFQGGLRVASISPVTNGVAITFATQSGKSYFLETSATFDPGAWQTVAGPVVGNNRLQSLTDTNAVNVVRFYRLRSM